MTLTTERQQFAEQNEMSMDFVNWFFDEKKESFGNMWFLMAAALWEGWKGRANREAQPVAIGEVRLGQQDDVGCFPSARVICLHEQADWDNFPDGTKLYTAPPAPAVPEEISSSIRHLKDTLVACNRFNYCADAVNRVEDACRAAMLAQPVSQRYTLPEGWIACSERMPDNDETKPIAIYTGKCLGQGMFVATYDEDGFFDYWEGGEIIGVTHWMPLPAAPEGGN